MVNKSTRKNRGKVLVGNRGGNGFTLIELLVLVVILATVAAFAIPSFTQVIQSNRVATQVNTLIASLNLARSDAVKSSTTVKVTAYTSGGVTNFMNGWCVHTGSTCSGTDLIRTFGPLKQVNVNETASELVFASDGSLSSPAAGATIKIYGSDCPSGESNGVRVIQVSVIGRASLSKENCP